MRIEDSFLETVSASVQEELFTAKKGSGDSAAARKTDSRADNDYVSIQMSNEEHEPMEMQIEDGICITDDMPNPEGAEQDPPRRC